VKQREEKISCAGLEDLFVRAGFILLCGSPRPRPRESCHWRKKFAQTERERGETENFLMPLSNKTLMRCKFFVFLNFKSDSAPDEALVSFYLRRDDDLNGPESGKTHTEAVFVSLEYGAWRCEGERFLM
jgi:hypothetical protein